jgi:hypothetical protein
MTLLNGHEAPDILTVQPEVLTVPRDTSFEHALDETAPKPEAVHESDGIEIPRLGGERRDIIPEHLRTWKGVRSTCGKYLDAARFHALFHLLRAPMYLVLGAMWAVVGVVRIANRQRAWWWLDEQTYLRSKTVVEGNTGEWRKPHSDLRRCGPGAAPSSRRAVRRRARAAPHRAGAWCAGSSSRVAGAAARSTPDIPSPGRSSSRR